MKTKSSNNEKHLLKKVFWGTVAVIAFMKAIEGPEHIDKHCGRKKHKRNQIIYIYK